MGIKEFKILFDNPVKTYSPGETISGRVILDLDSVKKCRGIKVKVSGKALTRWARLYAYGTRNVQGREKYLSSIFYIAGGKSVEINLNSGEHIFPFEYVLPTNLPTSYELKLLNDQAHIRYIVKAIIDWPWKSDNEIEAAFTVISKYDLNADPFALEQIFEERTKTFGIFSSSPPLTASLSLPFRGYVPGQIIPVSCNVNNQSGIEINDIKLRMKMYATFSSTPFRSIKKIVSKTIVKERMEKIERDFLSFNHEIIVPPIPPSNIGTTCNIISIAYTIELEVEVNKVLSINLKVSAPIVIGTIPLANCLSFANSLSIKISPVYEKSTFVVEQLTEENDTEHTMSLFAPKYPVYSFTAFQEDK
ncbi:arrestin domain-containing protein 17-like isoform X2 [Leptopilina boulardi]|uniref:arrestin domain-containing protein 17-like isoform X2 n=1 Tax=Leptopilina boulardi TaxID=63433 RepID=UPI0021F5FDC2|nr:arrestin domain-containing protein 17-like isoform X2 [Leptopilina boulardi]